MSAAGGDRRRPEEEAGLPPRARRPVVLRLSPHGTDRSEQRSVARGRRSVASPSRPTPWPGPRPWGTGSGKGTEGGRFRRRPLAGRQAQDVLADLLAEAADRQAFGREARGRFAAEVGRF